MAFTPNDDINFLQASDSPIVGAGAGDDLYIVSPDLLTDGQAVQLSDNQGTNTLQLTDGLSIASSLVANDALLLTLSNGAEITLLGSSTFLFDVGGAPLAPAETGMTYGDFVQGVLGVTVPEPGEPPVEIEDPIVIGEDPVDITPPELEDTDPVDDAVDVPVDTDITLTFNEDVQAGTGTIDIFEDGVATPVQTINVTNAVFVGNTVTIDLPTDLTGGTDYHVRVAPGAIEDLEGNDFAGILDPTVFNFSTAGDPPGIVIDIDTEPFPTQADFDAGGDAYNFIDDASVSNYAVIDNFSEDDTISFVNADVDDYAFSNEGEDVTLSYNYNDEGTMNVIILTGIVSEDVLVYDLTSFTDAIGFNPFG